MAKNANNVRAADVAESGGEAAVGHISEGAAAGNRLRGRLVPESIGIDLVGTNRHLAVATIPLVTDSVTNPAAIARNHRSLRRKLTVRTG